MRAGDASAQHRGRGRLHGNDADLGILRLQILAHARDGPAGPHTGDKQIDRAIRILPDLRTGGLTVCGGVGGVAELIRNKGMRNLLCQFFGFGDGALHAGGAVGENQLRTVGLHQLPAFQTHGLGHDDDHAVTTGRAHGGKTDACVAGGGFNDHGFLFQESFRFRVVDHGQGHAVLGGTGGVEILQLGQDPGFETLRLLQMGQFQQRSFTDQLINGRKDCRHVVFLLK